MTDLPIEGTMPEMDDFDTNTAPKKPHISFSQFSTWDRCAMQYYFRYILKIRGRPSIPLARGKSGHAAVEWNFAKKITSGEDQPTDEILDLFSDHYDAAIHEFEPDDFMPGDDPGKAKDETVELLRHWREHPTEGATTVQPLAVEVAFAINLPKEESYEVEVPEVVGRVDLLGRRIAPVKKLKTKLWTPPKAPPAALEVLDHKFVGKMKPQGETDLSTQLDLYDYVFDINGVKVDNVGLEYFIPATKTLGPRVIQSYRSPEYRTPEQRQNRFHRLVYKLQTFTRAVKAGIFWPKDNPQVCGRCEYRNMCQFSQAKDDFVALKVMQETAAGSD